MKLARASRFTTMTTGRRTGLVLATAAGGAALLSLPSVHARERDEQSEEPTADMSGADEESTEAKHEEVWEEEKGTFLRPYITSVRIAAQETADDACAQWKSFKDQTDFDRRWDTTKQHATRYYWLITGHRLGPEITFAATAGVLTLFATRKVLRLPFRLALLSGGITTAALLPPYEKTVPYLVDQYETFEWAKVADKLDPVALKDAAIDEIKASLPFGLGGKKTAKKDVEELLEEKKEQHVDVARPEETHAAHRHAHAAGDKACCDDEDKKTESHHHHHAEKKEHHHQERHHHDEEKEVLDVDPLSDKEDEDVL